MKDEFYTIYENLYRRYKLRKFRKKDPLDIANQILEIIKQTIDNQKNLLRPDAKYFLIVNFDHLIIRPLINLNSNKTPVDFYTITIASIQNDIKTIIFEAEKEVGQGEISGHQIMKTIDRIWKNLYSTRLEIWG